MVPGTYFAPCLEQVTLGGNIPLLFIQFLFHYSRTQKPKHPINSEVSILLYFL